MRYMFVVPREKGDEELFARVFQVNIPTNIATEVYSVFDEDNKKFNIFEKYNRCVEELIKKGLEDDDVIIFSHNDTGILDSEFSNKLEIVFNETKCSAVGVVGTRELKDSACWWNTPEDKLCGHIIQGSKSKGYMEGIHLVKGKIGYFDDVISFDGLFFCVKGKVFNDGIRFRSDIFSANHFYDISFCLDMLLAGYQIGIIDLLVYHRSEGSPNNNEVWVAERDKFLNHYKSLGLSFPIDKTTIDKYLNNKQSTVVEEFTL